MTEIEIYICVILTSEFDLICSCIAYFMFTISFFFENKKGKKISSIATLDLFKLISL